MSRQLSFVLNVTGSAALANLVIGAALDDPQPQLDFPM
jgi:hypothetical protein